MDSSFKDDMWGVDLVDMQLLSKFNNGFRFLLCVIDVFSKYAWFIPLKDKKGIILLIMIILLIVGLTKKILHKMSQYFPKPCEPFDGGINVTVI